MTQPANDIALAAATCQSEDDFTKLRARYVAEWGSDREDHPLRPILEDAIERRRMTLRRLLDG